jgi:hypothetical protein
MQYDDDQQLAAGVDPLVAEALRHWNVCVSATDRERKETDLDHAFFLGDQWAGELSAMRDALIAQNAPALVFNDLQQYVYNVVNEQSQNPSEIQISPERGATAEATSTVLQDLVRQIRTKHQGNIAINGAFADMVIGGRGWFQLCTEYPKRSMKQRIVFEPCDWDSAFLDPSATYPTYRDANFGFKFTSYSRQEFKRKWPHAKPLDAIGIGAEQSGWLGADEVRVAQYFYVKHVIRTLVQLQSGEAKYLDELNPLTDYPLLDSSGQAVSREEDTREVWICKLNAAEVLEAPVKWITSFIPLIPVVGLRGKSNGEARIFGLLRAARDPQIASNFMQNLQLENVAAGSKSPWLLDADSVENFEKDWGEANVKRKAFLKFKRYNEAGQDLGAPIRNNLEPPVQATQGAINELQMSKQRSMGLYEPSLGKAGPEESAAAILARQHQGQYANVRWVAALEIALKYAGEQLLEMIPVIYDAGQLLRLEGLDQKSYSVQVFNSQTQDPNAIKLEAGVKAVFDLSEGEFSVAVATGPSRDTQRQEAQKFFEAFAQSAPEMIPRFAYLWARSMDFPGKDELADALMPQDIAAKQGDPKAMLAQAQQAMKQKDQMVMHLSQMVQQLTQEKQAKITEIQGRAAIDQNKQASQERIEKARVAKDVLVEEIRQRADMSQTVLDHQVAKIESQLDREHEVHMSIFDSAQQPADPGTAQPEPVAA